MKEADAGDGKKAYFTEIAPCENDHMLVVSESTYLVFGRKLIPKQYCSEHNCVCRDAGSIAEDQWRVLPGS